MRHHKPITSYRQGIHIHHVTRVDLARHMADPDPVPPPGGDPVPPPPDNPCPPPEPEPIPTPPDDPIPPPDPNVHHDHPLVVGTVVLANAKNPVSHRGAFWWRVTDRTLDAWRPEDALHLAAYLATYATERRANFAFCLSATSPWWGMAQEVAVMFGGLVWED